MSNPRSEDRITAGDRLKGNWISMPEREPAWQ